MAGASKHNSQNDFLGRNDSFHFNHHYLGKAPDDPDDGFASKVDVAPKVGFCPKSLFGVAFHSLITISVLRVFRPAASAPMRRAENYARSA